MSFKRKANALEMKGQTLVNIASNVTNVFTERYIIGCNMKKEMVKPSTVYTIICINNGTSTPPNALYVGDNNSRQILLNKTYGTALTFVTPSTIDMSYDINLFCYPTSNFVSGDSEKIQWLLIEGNHLDKPLSYFEGLQSVGEEVEVEGEKRHKIEILSVGKNLFSVDHVGVYFGASGDIASESDSLLCEKYCKVSEGMTFIANNISGSVQYVEYDSNKNVIQRVNKAVKLTYTVPSGVHYLRFSFYRCGVDYTPQIEFGTETTNYEPYRTPNKTEIFLNEPLRSLPNGVADTVEIKDGKLIVTRNVHQITLNGNEGITWRIGSHSSETTNTYFYTNMESPLLSGTQSNKQVWDRFIMSNPYTKLGNGAFLISMNNQIQLRIRVSEIEQTSESFNTWLRTNNVNVIYELAEPIIETTTCTMPEIYEDSNVTIRSGAVPVSSLRVLQIRQAGGVKFVRNFKQAITNRPAKENKFIY